MSHFDTEQETTPVLDADLASQFALKREVVNLRELIERYAEVRDKQDQRNRNDFRTIYDALNAQAQARDVALIEAQASIGTGDKAAAIAQAIDQQTNAEKHYLGHIYDQTKEQVPLLLRLDGRLDNANKELIEQREWLRIIAESVSSTEMIHKDVHALREAKRPEPVRLGVIVALLFLIVLVLCGILVLLAMNLTGATVPDWTWAGPPSQHL